MGLIFIVVLGFIVISIIASLVGPLIALGIGVILAYLAYQHLNKAENSLLGIIWWVFVGIVGIGIIFGILPNFIIITAIISVIVGVIYYASRKSSLRTSATRSTTKNQTSAYKTYESFESEWREITKR